jgi:cell division protein FtsQ
MPRVKPRPAPMPLPDRPGRWKLLWRRQRKLLRPTAFASIAVIVLITGFIAVNTIGQGPSLGDRLGRATAGAGLAIRNVQIVGREKTPEAMLTAAIAATPGKSILNYSISEARARIENIAWVRSAIVERVLPDTIRVVLNERRPFAVWQNQGKFTLIDQAGNIVTDSDISNFADKLPLVVGLGAPLAAGSLLRSLAEFPILQSHLVAAVRVGERRWDLCMTSGANVLLPEGAEPQALAKLAELQTSKSLLDRPLQEIDLRLPDRLRVRPMSEGPCSQAGDRIAIPARPVAPPPRRAT